MTLPLVCNLVDISRHGIRFSTHEEVEIADTIGKIITLSGANGQFATFLNGSKGKIIGVDKNFYGVYFEKPLFDDSIRLNKFMGELRYNWVANEY